MIIYIHEILYIHIHISIYLHICIYICQWCISIPQAGRLRCRKNQYFTSSPNMEITNISAQNNPAGGSSLSLMGVCLFVVFSPSTDWNKVTHIRSTH